MEIFTVLVEGVSGYAHAIRFGAQGREADAHDLARSLSGGIGRDTINIQTAYGPVFACAMLVQDAQGTTVARYIDGKLAA